MNLNLKLSNEIYTCPAFSFDYLGAQVTYVNMKEIILQMCTFWQLELYQRHLRVKCSE
jgi:hypothetical protein